VGDCQSQLLAQGCSKMSGMLARLALSKSNTEERRGGPMIPDRYAKHDFLAQIKTRGEERNKSDLGSEGTSDEIRRSTSEGIHQRRNSSEEFKIRGEEGIPRISSEEEVKIRGS